MKTSALAIAVLFTLSCKKEPPKGDLPPMPSGAATAAAPATPPPAPAPAAPAEPGATAAAPGNPHGGMAPEPTPPRALEQLADGSYVVGPFAMTVPKDWTVRATKSRMRVAEIVLPGKQGEQPELIIYFFGATGAGTVDANMDRWLGQIQQPDGKPSRDVAKLEKTKFGGQDATFVSVSGRYVAAAMPGATDAVDKADQTLLGAIVGSPAGPYYFKLVGPKATVDASTATFKKMLESLKLR